MIRQLAHVCFYTDRYSEMVDFYGQKLALTLKFKLQNRNGVPFGSYFDCGNSTFIEVFDRSLAIEEWGGEWEPTRGSKCRHICFEVTDLAATRAELSQRGLHSTDPKVGKDESIQSWIVDPDGNDIELMEYTGTSLQLRGSAL